MADDNRQPDLPTPPKGARAPAAAMMDQRAPRFAGEDDASAEANAKVAADIATNAARPIPYEQLVTASTGMEGMRAMWIIVGPYKGSVLTMPDAEAEDAKDSHWAINMSDMQGPFDANAPLEHDHELTDEDRAYAVEAANAWAQAQSDPEEPEEEAPQNETPDASTEREQRNKDRQKRNEGRQARNKPQRKDETDEQRQAREKRNAEHNERAMQPDRTGGEYTTRAPGRVARQPEPPKR
jgi:hypothetical protein